MGGLRLVLDLEMMGVILKFPDSGRSGTVLPAYLFQKNRNEYEMDVFIGY